jgi:hypothetical protein
MSPNKLYMRGALAPFASHVDTKLKQEIDALGVRVYLVRFGSDLITSNDYTKDAGSTAMLLGSVIDSAPFLPGPVHRTVAPAEVETGFVRSSAPGSVDPELV